MERYSGVHGVERVARIRDALERGGARIVDDADPRTAPFEFRVVLPSGEPVELICYAFTANKYRQADRPADEHRMQVKYGSDFTRAHTIHIDPSRSKLTLMFGVHDERDVFVAVDPVMHSPTWFSSSIEFKDDDLESAIASGWHGWERERHAGGRRRVMPAEDLRVETVIAFSPEHFVRYIVFEHAATGLDPGERLLLSDRIAADIKSGKPPPRLLSVPRSGKILEHPLELQLGLTAREVLDVIAGRFRLLAAVRGSVAEHHLERQLQSDRAIADVTRIDEDGQPDFIVRLNGANHPVRVECKNVLRRVTPHGPRVDFQKTRASTSDRCSRYYAETQFEVLAACLHPVTERWEFRFQETTRLPKHSRCPGKLSERVFVESAPWASPSREGPWTASLGELLARIAS